MAVFEGAALEHGAALTSVLFEALRRGSFDPVSTGVCRDTYGEGEQFAHDLMGTHAQQLGLDVWHDHLRNTYMVWPGHRRDLPAIVIGSHLDSVPSGGNFDGAAGVVAGLVAIDLLKQQGVVLERDVVVMGIRAEESIWFQHSYIGSRGALGTLDPSALNQRRVDTGKTLEQIEAFFEVHIEQAPSLAADGYPVAIGTAIPGNIRYARARITGEYGHVGLPKRFRRDAALAGAELFVAMQAYWDEQDLAGRPMAFTIGEFHTDAGRHGLTIVSGEFRFSIDMRAYDEQHLNAIEKHFLAVIAEIETRRSVRFDLGPRSTAPVALAKVELSQALRESAQALEIRCTDLLSPASHDAAAFCAAGVPYGFVFIRNANGSHHPEEAMDEQDFMLATEVLAHTLQRLYAC